MVYVKSNIHETTDGASNNIDNIIDEVRKRDKESFTKLILLSDMIVAKHPFETEDDEDADNDTSEVE